MKLNCKNILLFFCFFLPSACASNHGLDGYQQNVINASKNARLHNNMGNIYFEEKNYSAALKEYQIAHALTYDSNTSSTYLYNIARCYMKFGAYQGAKQALLEAIAKDCINLVYYETLVDCFIALNTAQNELKKYINDNSIPYNRIVAGLIYLKTGQKTNAKAIFDEFVNKYPDMIITEDIKRILKNL